MKFSVIIPTTLERKTILQTINSLKEQTFRDFEVILSTNRNGISDEIKMTLDDRFKLIKVEKPGLSIAKNEAIKRSHGEFISFLDDDAIADKNWLKNISIDFENPKIGIIGGPIYPIWPKKAFNTIKKSTLAKEWLSILNYSQKKTPIDRVFGCNFSVRKSLFNEFGLFKTNFGRVNNNLMGGEDTEFCDRVRNKYEILYDPNIKVSHVIAAKRVTLKWIFKRAYYGGYSKAIQKRKPQKISRERYGFFDYFLLLPYAIGYSKGLLEGQ